MLIKSGVDGFRGLTGIQTLIAVLVLKHDDHLTEKNE